ncbi:MAG: ATP-dependent Clp protease adaptor ClpS [Nitrospiria bacterium]
MNPPVIDHPDVTTISDSETATALPWSVVLYNDEHHAIDAVIFQVQKATGVSLQDAFEITMEAHTKGRAACFSGTMHECQSVANILREINLIVEIESRG